MKKKVAVVDVDARRAQLLAAREKLVRELQSAKEADPFWFFEPTTGEITEERMEFLRRHLKEEDIPARLDGQVDFFRATAPVVMVSGGNRSGKSVSAGIFAFIWITGRVPKSLEGIFPLESLPPDRCRDVRVTGVTNKQLMNTVIPTYQKWVPREYLKGGKWTESWSAEQKTLSLYEKGKFIGLIEFMTNEQDVTTFQGPDRGLMVYDEQPREDIRKENLLRMAATTGVKEIFGFTPTEGLTWATDLMAEGEDDAGREVDVIKLVSVTNPKVGIEVLDSIVREITDYNEIKMRLTGAVVSLSGLIYGSLFDMKTHVIEPFFDDLPAHEKRNYMLLTGMDPHSVTPTAMVFMLVDREGNKYVDTCWDRDADTAEVKAAWWRIVKDNGYRPGWAVADRSSDTSIIAFGGKNIFRELSRGEDAIPAMRTSEKFEGSIRAGVDEIKKDLKDRRLFIVNRPENKKLIQSFRTLERDTHANEDKKGPKDKILEGKHHLHAALRYIHQFPISYISETTYVPEPDVVDELVGW